MASPAERTASPWTATSRRDRPAGCSTCASSLCGAVCGNGRSPAADVDGFVGGDRTAARIRRRAATNTTLAATNLEANSDATFTSDCKRPNHWRFISWRLLLHFYEFVDTLFPHGSDLRTDQVGERHVFHPLALRFLLCQCEFSHRFSERSAGVLWIFTRQWSNEPHSERIFDPFLTPRPIGAAFVESGEARSDRDVGYNQD